jgi:hypothetical protein
MLQAIISGITLAQKRVSAGRSEDAARLLDAAREAASRVTALTQRLLAFGRRQALNPKPIDPGSAAADRLVARVLSYKSVQPLAQRWARS